MSTKPTILLVDDDRHIMELVQALLLTLKADLLYAPIAQDGIRIAQEKQPTLILMDLLLPAPSLKGWDAISVLKSDETTSHIPVIALTAASGENVKRAMDAGADAYTAKPFNMRQFRQMITEHIGAIQP